MKETVGKKDQENFIAEERATDGKNRPACQRRMNGLKETGSLGVIVVSGANKGEVGGILRLKIS